jgi:putative nucleotidyltransferase with HDIG domain
MNDNVEDKNGGADEISTVTKLLDTQYPLLARFRELCPGTFKHSQALASMIEGVSISLGLDSDLMRLAATYHDVGKMFNPKYFTENQLEDEDAHKNLDPKISYEIITRHVSDSAMILINDQNFPRKVIEIISQHHGQNVLKYFFRKSGKQVEDLYRYKTTKPTCIESAVLMICDAIEATSRSRAQSGNFNPVEVIETTINELIDDSQLDEVTMKLGDLKKIKLALGKELEGTYQKRVDYNIVPAKATVSGLEPTTTISG